MNKIAVIITTIKKDAIMIKYLPSLLNKDLTIYLLDQGKMTSQKEMFYNDLKAKGQYIYCIEKDIGLSAARNFLINKIVEPYFLIVDDDVELLSNPNDILHHFDENPKIGIVGGCLFNVAKNSEHHYEYALEIKNRTLYLKVSDNIDLVLNFFIARTEIFKDIQWDEQLLMVEHTDFFLRFKQLNKWIVIYDKKLFGKHYSYDLRPLDYKSFRYIKVSKCLQLFHKKWNITSTQREYKK